MSKISATIEIQNSELLGVDVCSICEFKQLIFDDKPCKCKVFNKVLERFNPLPDMSVKILEFRRLQECKDSEVDERKL